MATGDKNMTMCSLNDYSSGWKKCGRKIGDRFLLSGSGAFIGVWGFLSSGIFSISISVSWESHVSKKIKTMLWMQLSPKEDVCAITPFREPPPFVSISWHEIRWLDNLACCSFQFLSPFSSPQVTWEKIWKISLLFSAWGAKKDKRGAR